MIDAKSGKRAGKIVVQPLGADAPAVTISGPILPDHYAKKALRDAGGAAAGPAQRATHLRVTANFLSEMAEALRNEVSLFEELARKQGKEVEFDARRLHGQPGSEARTRKGNTDVLLLEARAASAPMLADLLEDACSQLTGRAVSLEAEEAAALRMLDELEEAWEGIGSTSASKHSFSE